MKQVIFITIHASNTFHTLSDIPRMVFTIMIPAEFICQSSESLESS